MLRQLTDISVVINGDQSSDPSAYKCHGATIFELAMQESALFHMFLCSSVVYVDLLNGEQESVEATHHKLNAIRAINCRLRDAAFLPDSLIGAVSYLAKVEVHTRRDYR